MTQTKTQLDKLPHLRLADLNLIDKTMRLFPTVADHVNSFTTYIPKLEDMSHEAAEMFEATERSHLHEYQRFFMDRMKDVPMPPLIIGAVLPSYVSKYAEMIRAHENAWIKAMFAPEPRWDVPVRPLSGNKVTSIMFDDIDWPISAAACVGLGEGRTISGTLALAEILHPTLSPPIEVPEAFAAATPINNRAARRRAGRKERTRGQHHR